MAILSSYQKLKAELKKAKENNNKLLQDISYMIEYPDSIDTFRVITKHKMYIQTRKAVWYGSHESEDIYPGILAAIERVSK